MGIQLVTDSTCDLPQSVIDQYGIHVLPVMVNINGTEYRDGVDISREDFYAQLKNLDNKVGTAATPPRLAAELFESLPADDEILCIMLSSGLSATIDAVNQGAKAAGREIIMHDSESLSVALGYQVTAAAEVIANGGSSADAIAAAEAVAEKSYFYALLDTLEFLKRGGRVSGIQASVGSVLQFKPLLHLADGKVAPHSRPRTTKKAFKKLIELGETHGKLEKLGIIHANAPERAAAAKEALQGLVEGEIVIVPVTPAIGVHAGPDMVGISGVMK